ncbi:hypothetical protein FHR83_002353 [Actinoplanes campanulatus]|uniref:SWIM-type domain-containing protein n=1 Tax=Actinoplanes campanulatus TaxID=113559 RepID=A0A7W5FDT8_9ACTN|nr:hypothetical protein [Actinoplanes campanulatus]MBB3094690.1 hypothetical protein [Actinoplanes campanulatus]GGN06836.1 hypothetical protein GCM10010109_14780 [Actinoplanes campanulatus]GID35986.1 hypothetical protein Aca09nite_24920 [Actinoplanes campanulatus]
MAEFPLAFLGMFEALRMGPTFARGRRDERAGHVRSLTVSGSLVVALVRGPDDPVAFRARIAVRAFGASEWARVETALVAEARFVADLLDGRMPAGVEAVFAEAGLSLLPLSLDEVAMDCTCERWPMPCAHLAATCYALARAFEADPFEVFTWRGRPRDELLMRLRRLREAAAVDAIGSGAAARESSSGLAGAGASAPAGGAVGAAGGAAGTFDPVGGAAGSGSDGGAASGFGSAAGRAKGSDVAGSAGAVWAAAADPVAFWGRPDPGEAGSVAEPSGLGSGGRESGGRESGGLGSGGRESGGLGSGGLGSGGRGPDRPGAGGGGSDEAGASGRGVSGAGTGERDGGLRPDALLDQLDAPGLAHHGRAIVEVLRPAYRALPDGDGAYFAT